jgi:ATP adenylyltransferase
MSLERLWAGWRSDYVSASGEAGAGELDEEGSCVFCRILASGESDEAAKVVWRGARVVAILNAYPYTSGHLMVMPIRHVGELDELGPDGESHELWAAVIDGVKALKVAYRPEGINVGANLGKAAGAGVPGHLHVHLVPRWNADTNFMTSIAEARVLPESLTASWSRLTDSWP